MSESKSKKVARKEEAMPIEVQILTPDHEIQGLIYVARDADDSRRISELLNDQDKRFLAVTDAKLMSRKTPGTPQRFPFLQVHMDNIMLLHPSAQSLGKQTGYSPDKAARLGKIREKLK